MSFRPSSTWPHYPEIVAEARMLFTAPLSFIMTKAAPRMVLACRILLELFYIQPYTQSVTRFYLPITKRAFHTQVPRRSVKAIMSRAWQAPGPILIAGSQTTVTNTQMASYSASTINTSCYFVSYHIIPYHIILYHIVSYHITSHHITSYHIIFYHILSYYIIFHFLF